MPTVTITHDTVTPHLKKLMADMKPGGALQKVLGRGGANALRRHFRDLNAKRPNKLGGKRTNFYSRVAESVNAPVNIGRTIRIAIAHPHLAQRLYGGTITPRKRKMLAIPAHASAHGISPRVYPGPLAYIPTLKGGVLVQGEERTITRGKRKGGKRIAPKQDGAVIYALKGAITQRADPSVMIAATTMTAALTEAAEDHLASLQ